MGEITCEAFELELREALAHLYDPDYQPSVTFCELVGCDPRGGAFAVQAAILRAIGELEPSPGIPPTAETRRVFELLHNRFVLKLTQEETAERLHVSLSSVQRGQREAIHVLARTIWERSQAQRRAARERLYEEQASVEEAHRPDWRSQVREELASLRSVDPNRVADVAEILHSVLELKNALITDHGVDLEIGYIQPNLVATTHPSALRQTLIAALGRLARRAAPGKITIFARLREGNAEITVRGPIAKAHQVTGEELTREILVPEGTTVEASIEGAYAFLRINAPSLGQITVLLVDDNPDMLQFCRRCTTGTRYHIIHAAGGMEALEKIKAAPPDIVVLDVMLPDVDGWKLLMQLHEDPTTRPIPVIVCSVVREEELAYALGAALYLPKPVEPRQFVSALDQVRPPEPAGVQKVPPNSAVAG
ncbi:MAG: response regulator [Anaerolineae bacterium]|nr:response regulator [Anaerolineae bacterium]